MHTEHCYTLAHIKSHLYKTKTKTEKSANMQTVIVLLFNITRIYGRWHVVHTVQTGLCAIKSNKTEYTTHTETNHTRSNTETYTINSPILRSSLEHCAPTHVCMFAIHSYIYIYTQFTLPPSSFHWFFITVLFFCSFLYLCVSVSVWMSVRAVFGIVFGKGTKECVLILYTIHKFRSMNPSLAS